MRRALPLPILAALALPVLVRPLAAEEPDATARIRLPDIVRVEEYSDPEHGTAMAFLGTMRFGRPGLFSVEAERFVIWFDPRAEENLFSVLKKLRGEEGEIPIWAIRAVYAEGAGRAPLRFQAAGQMVQASSLYYDLQAHEGIFLDTEFRVRRRNPEIPDDELPDLVFRARRLRARGPGRWSADDVSLFSSDYVRPELQLRIRELRIENAVVRKALGRLMLLSARGAATLGGPTVEELEALEGTLADVQATQEATHGTLRGVSARAWGVPFFAWRGLGMDGGDLDATIVRAEGGQIGSMGRGGYLAVGRRGRPFGWVIGGGAIDGHGPLVDTELELDAFGGRVKGKTLASWFHDRGTDFNGFVPPHEDRYWWQNRYRFGLTDKLRFDVEYTLLSDEHYLRIYDEGEFKEGKPQESLGYLRWKDNAFYGTLIYQWRTIDFLDTVEQLPVAGFAAPALTLLRVGTDGTGRPILLQLGFETQLGNFRFRGGADDPDVEYRTPRFDVDPTLYVAFNLGPVRITPFATFRYTGYDEALDGSGANRFAGSAGIRAAMALYRWFGDVQHVINLSLSYEDLYSVNVAADELYFFDDVDAIAPWEGFIARMRHRFLTKTPLGGRREFLNFEIAGAWFPDGQAPLGVRSDGFVDLDLQWYPKQGFLVDVRGEYFPDDGTLQTGSVMGTWGANSDRSFTLGMRHLHDDSDVLTGGAEFLVQDRWRIGAFSQYDVKNSDALDQSLLLQRVGPTFLLGFRVKYKPGEDRVTFAFKFDLLERFQAHRRDRVKEELRREMRFGR